MFEREHSNLTERDNLLENLPTQGRFFFFRKPNESIDAIGSVTEGVFALENKFMNKYYFTKSHLLF